MSVGLVIEITADGSHTLFLPELEEHYHSVNGAVQESKHVFIEAGLRQVKQDVVHIFEVGFGTGLNAFLSLVESDAPREIHYTTIEAYPLPLSIIRQLNYAEKYSREQQELFYKLHEAEWGTEQQITPYFYLTKIQADLNQLDFSSLESADIIYFDAFAPDKQAEMWSQHIFDHMYNISNEQGLLVTYCAKGVVRRMMQQSGYKTERLPGPPGKREMLRATKL
ncbi:MAG: tRNA (5-methylaminomethyl-2-thiouridine)(34)-methyltransferase MnmD [Prevotella sp.]|jgi:tRNA U34 5-methylaminomethyl-2-thiouridine-forming methyltransferase MnmC|nr:tRNA (5-methylaminomethyl-2-thiouridine)(34)-methyltransferase MnmD [Prevotella sp.]